MCVNALNKVRLTDLSHRFVLLNAPNSPVRLTGRKSLKTDQSMAVCVIIWSILWGIKYGS